MDGILFCLLLFCEPHHNYLFLSHLTYSNTSSITQCFFFFYIFYKVIWDLLNDDDSLDLSMVWHEQSEKKSCRIRYIKTMRMRFNRWEIENWNNKKKTTTWKELRDNKPKRRLDLIITKCAMILNDFGRWVAKK